MIESLAKLAGYYLGTPNDNSLNQFFFTITRDGNLVSSSEHIVNGRLRVVPMRLRCEVVEAGVLATHALDRNNKEVVHHRMDFTISDDGGISFVRGDYHWSCKRIDESDISESILEVLQIGLARSRDNLAEQVAASDR